MKISRKSVENIEQNHFPRASEENSKSSILNYIREWCLDTTSHGFSNIVKSKYWIAKIVWILFVIGGISYCFYSNKIALFYNFLILLFIH